MKAKLMENERAGGKRFDVELFVVILCLVILLAYGCIFVYSASLYTAEKVYDDRFYFLKKQIIGYVVGVLAFFAVWFIKPHMLKKVAFPACCVTAVLLLLVLTPLGVEVYGAKRWIGLGAFTVQPSDFAKLALVLFSAVYFSDDLQRAQTLRGSLPVICIGAVFCLLVIAEPNMSITVCLAAVLAIMLFAAGFPIKKLVLFALPLLIALPVLIIAEPYRLKRLYAFLDPWSSPKAEGYQLIQSLYALGSGGLFGVGLFNSRQKLRFLPFAESDFILSVIGEETGFFGVVLLLGVCIVLAVAVVRLGKRKGDFFTYLLSVGVAAVFLVQIAINALVVTGSIPPTGVPFPLVSSGNTQIVTFAASFGLICSLSRKRKPAVLT